jgi:hypothetical protein
MNRHPTRKTTNVQAETTPAPPEATEAPPTARAEPPPLSTGWKVAILVWVLGFFGLCAFEVINVVWQLVTK